MELFRTVCLSACFAAPVLAQPAPAIEALRARQAQERSELAVDHKRRTDELRKSTASDQELFKRDQKQKKRDFEESLKAEDKAFAASLEGLDKDQRKLKKREYKLQRKSRKAAFRKERSEAGVRFYHDLQAKWDYLKEVQGKERAQLEEKQRSELARLQP